MGRLVAIVVAVAAVAGARAAVAADERPTLVVVPFTGPQSREAEAVVVRTLRKKATLIPQTTWVKSAQKLFARTHSPEDIAAVAEDIGAKIVITGVLKRDGRQWQLSVSVKDGKSGKTQQRLRYPVKGTRPRLTATTLALLAKEADEAFDSVVAPGRENAAVAEKNPAAASAPAATATPATSPTPTPTKTPTATPAESKAQAEPGREETPPGMAEPPPPTVQVKLTAPGRKRPRWAPYFDVEAGGTISGRSFDYDPASQPKFSSGVVAGVHGDLTVYPLASTWDRAGGAFSGLGVGASVDVPFWPDSTSKQDATQKFPTKEFKVEGGLRWRIVLYKPVPRPQLLLQAGYGYHSFSIGKTVDMTTGLPVDVGPADVAYKYVTVGGGLRIHFAEWAWLWAMFDYHVVLASGPVSGMDEYGPTSTYGIRVRGGLDFLVYKGLKLGAGGFYERFSLKFAGTGTKPANSGLDQYFGGQLFIGYVL